jgi:phospholipase/carboxylesterase
MMQPTSQLSLDHFVQDPRITSEHPPLLILLHGFGSNERDLYLFAREMPPEYLVITVRAPRTLARGSYAWFAIDFSSGTPVNDKAQAEESRLILKQFIDDAIATYLTDSKRVYLLGFSQGAIMSYSVALTYPGLIRGVVALSGRILKEIREKVRKEGNEDLKIFIGHGTLDTVLGINFAREAKEYLSSLGVYPEYHEYPIAHGISSNEVADVVRWVTSQKS